MEGKKTSDISDKTVFVQWKEQSTCIASVGHLAKTLSLVRWQREDAGDVVVFGRLLLFGKVTDNVEAAVVPLTPGAKLTSNHQNKLNNPLYSALT